MEPQAEGAVDAIHQLQDPQDFSLDLFGGHEDVGVVLVKGPHPEQSVEHAAQFVAVHQAHFGGPDGQVAIGGVLAAEEQHAARAVHGLDGVVGLVDDRGVHVFAVVFPVAAALPQLALEHDGRFGLHVAGGAVLVAPVVHQGVPHGHALGMKKGHARRLVVEAEQVQGRADAPVVALARLFQQGEVGAQLLLVEIGRAVNALELGLGLIGAPVSARGLHQLEGFDETGVGHMGPTAQIGELALGIEGDGAVLQILNHLQLVRFVRVEFEGVALGDLPALDGHLFLDDLFHLGFDAREGLFGDGRHVDVVIKAILHHRSDGQFGLGIEPQDGLGHHMRRAVAHDRPAPRASWW